MAAYLDYRDRGEGVVNRSKETWAILVLLAVIGTFYLGTIRDGHYWGGDFSMYIRLAQNIAEGRAYADTGYIYNPHAPLHAPRTYPPGFPLLLAPILRCCGLNFTLMKAEVIVCFLLALGLLYLTFRTDLPFAYLFAALALIGLNPFFWGVKDDVLSDLPFLLLLSLSIYIWQKGRDAAPPHRSLYVVSASLAMYAAYSTRSAGIVLIPSLLLHDLWTRKRVTRFALSVAILCSGLVVFNNLLVRGEGDYAKLLVADIRVPLHNLGVVVRNLGSIWRNAYSTPAAAILYVAVTGCAVAGYVTRLKQRTTLWEVFLPLYTGVLLLYPIEPSFRFLIPIVPLYVIYAFLGIRIYTAGKPQVARIAVLLLTAAAGLSYAGAYSKTDFGSIREGVRDPYFEQLCDYIRGNTKPQDVFVFQNPRVLALFTGRRVSIYQTVEAPDALWKYLDEIDARHIVVANIFEGDRRYLQPLVDQYRTELEKEYENAEFAVFRVKESR